MCVCSSRSIQRNRGPRIWRVDRVSLMRRGARLMCWIGAMSWGRWVGGVGSEMGFSSVSILSLEGMNMVLCGFAARSGRPS
jgi:hypothetical protein